MMILAIDPGKDKLGVALYDERKGNVIFYEIVSRDAFPEWLARLMEKYSLERFVIGDGTHSESVQAELQTLAPHCSIVVVDEAYSTLEARDLYFQFYPPKGVKRFLPRSLQTPGRPVDDLVAIIILKRYLGDMTEIGI